MAISINAAIEFARIAAPLYLQEGLSGAAALRRFRAEGYAIRTQTFYQLYRQARTIANLKPMWAVADTTKALPQQLFVLTDRATPTRYQYLFDAVLTDIANDKPQTITIGVYSEKRISIDQAMALANDRLQSDALKYQMAGFEIPEEIDLTFLGSYERSAVARREVGREE